MPEEIRLVVEECVEQFGREKSLLHYQRRNLFRGIVTYLYEHATFPMLEKYILWVSLHEAVQAIMDLEMDDAREITINVDPWRGE